jgi:hypothetical protein
MSFDTAAGTRGGRQPRTGLILRLVNKNAASRFRSTGKMLGINGLILTTVGAKKRSRAHQPGRLVARPRRQLADRGGGQRGGAEPSVVSQHRRSPRQRADRGGRPHDRRDGRAAPRGRARTGLAADRRRHAPLRAISEQDRPRAADHPPSTPIWLSHCRSRQEHHAGAARIFAGLTGPGRQRREIRSFFPRHAPHVHSGQASGRAAHALARGQRISTTRPAPAAGARGSSLPKGRGTRCRGPPGLAGRSPAWP